MARQMIRLRLKSIVFFFIFVAVFALFFPPFINVNVMEDGPTVHVSQADFELVQMDKDETDANLNSAPQLELESSNKAVHYDLPDVVKYITPAPLPKNVKEEDRKLIYFASRFFGGQFHFDELPTQCKTSSDPKDLHKADAVLFHTLANAPPGFRTEEERRKSNVSSDQIWIGVMYESPQNYPHLKGLYNYTMTFRRDSDIYSPYCGRFEVAEQGNAIADKEPSLELLRTSGNRAKKVVGLISNCHTGNKRMEYVKELSKYIDVDIYGRCSPNGLHCDRKRDSSCWEMIARDYKFFLSFENSHCKDYITEKFFTPAYYGVLPIVYGGSSVEDYRATAPSHSYIDTRDFASPKELAVYLHMLDNSPEEYNAYFRWRSHFMVHYNRTFVGQDIICSKLWNLGQNRKSYSQQEFDKWWLEGGQCVPPPWSP